MLQGAPDYLARLLHRGDVSWEVAAAGMLVAFGLGAIHALSPGHGKAVVAAYLVGTSGTFRHALLLGGMVTFTHTASVFALGLGTLFLSHYVVPDRILPALGVISGLGIVWVGALLLWRRIIHWRAHRHGHEHHHHHHHHDVTLGSLLTLAASGGLVPCPSALVLLLSSVALGRVGLGLMLLVGFSVGLAAVLIAIGAAVIYAKHLLPKSTDGPLLTFLPIVSAAVVICVGIFMTAAAFTGWGTITRQ